MKTTNGWTIATAESCTGGLIASRLTDVAGSSSYFMGGVVTYSNNAKSNLLQIPMPLIDNCGAVSEEVVIKMVDGVKRLFDTFVAVSISGIMGPGGGTDQKPIGTVWIGVMIGTEISSKQILLSGDRLQNKEKSVEAAMEFVLDMITKAEINDH